MTSTEVVRRFGDILAEVKHAGRSIVVTKNGEPYAELRPVGSEKSCSLVEFAAAWKASPTDPDEAFARDLETVNQSDRPEANPWA